jgi:glycosyltransferase involved in cell wall biosynthesis
MALPEGMACGTPVVPSATSSMPGVVADARLPFDPGKVENIASALMRVLTNSVLRMAQKARGRARAAQFISERTTKEMLAVYEALA